MHAPRLALALALAVTSATLGACRSEPWTDSEKDEAIRTCRSQFGFPPVSVFESQDVSYVRFMCQCEVEWLSERIPHRLFDDRLRANEVNRLLASGGAACLKALRDRGP